MKKNMNVVCIIFFETGGSLDETGERRDDGCTKNSEFGDCANHVFYKKIDIKINDCYCKEEAGVNILRARNFSGINLGQIK